MKRLLSILLLFTCVALTQYKPTATLYFAVMDKGPTTPWWSFVVDERVTDQVKRNQFVSMAVEPGDHAINYAKKDGKRDKHHPEDLKITVEPGQSKYFACEMDVSYIGATSYKFYELTKEEWDYRMPKLKPVK